MVVENQLFKQIGNFLWKFVLSLIKMKLLGWVFFSGTTQVSLHPKGHGKPILRIWQKM
jgi:hypothetical protein